MSLECFWTCFQSHSRLAQGFVRQGWEAAAVGGFVSPGAELDMCTARGTHGRCGNQLVAGDSFGFPRWTQGPGSFSAPRRACSEIAGGDWFWWVAWEGAEAV